MPDIAILLAWSSPARMPDIAILLLHQRLAATTARSSHQDLSCELRALILIAIYGNARHQRLELAATTARSSNLRAWNARHQRLETTVWHEIGTLVTSDLKQLYGTKFPSRCSCDRRSVYWHSRYQRRFKMFLASVEY
jgi:hypothetical protein